MESISQRAQNNKRKQKYNIKEDIAYLRSQKNSEKFCKLFDEGDISDYGSSSEADCALCALIAFRTGPDPAQIDAVYRHSALYRDKWERDDYREATIAAGIDACHGTFHRSKMDYPEFIRFNSMTGMPYVVTPLLAKYVREHVRYLLVRDNGKQGVLKYVYDGGSDTLNARFVKKADNSILLEVTGVSAENMDKTIIVTIPGLGTITFNGNAFARAMARNSSSETQQNLGAALYNYGAAAKTCFGA